MTAQESSKVLIAIICCFPFASLAEESDADKWGFSLGAFLTSQDMTTKFQTSGPGDGGAVDFEDDLGLDDSLSVFRLGAFYKINERHRLDFGAFDLSQSSVKTLSVEFEWQDTLYPVSADVRTNLDLTIYKAAYTYRLSGRKNNYLGLTGGLYVADIGLSLRLRLPGDQEVGDLTAPLPVVGFRGEYYLSKRWRTHASAEWFLLDAGDYHGSLQDILVGIDFRLFEQAAIGLGFNSMQMDLDATKKVLRADLRWKYAGVFAYLQFSF